MAKNMTRKGLAFGAGLALLGSMFTVLPAQAASVTLAPTLGTSTKTLSGETFSLVASLSNDIPTSNASQLKFRVTNPGAAAVVNANIGIGNVGSITAPAAVALVGGGNTATAITATDSAVVFAKAGITQGPVVLTLKGGDNTSFGVTAWVDSNGDGLTTGETISSEVTVTFVKVADATTNVVITAPTQGDTSVKATIDFVGLNNEQISAANVSAYISDPVNGALGGHATAAVDLITAAATLNSSKVFEVSAPSVGTTADKLFAALGADKAVSVQALYKVGAGWAKTDVVGAAVSANIAKQTIQSVVLDLENTTGSNGASDTFAQDKPFTVSAVVTDVDGKKVSGATVNLTLAEGNQVLSDTAGSVVSVTVNGVVYDKANKLPGATGVAAIPAVTNADGIATWNVATSGFAAAKTLKFNAKVGTKAATEYVATSAALTYTTYVSANTSDAATYEVAAVAGASIPMSVFVVDQFGGVPADGYDVRVLQNAGTRTGTGATQATNQYNAALSAGSATVTYVDNGVGLGTTTLTVGLWKRALGGGYTTADNAPIGTAEDVSITFKAAADLVAGKFAITGYSDTDSDGTLELTAGGQSVALALKTPGAFDARKVLGTNPAAAGTTLAVTTSTAGSTTTASIAIPGAPVTFSGKGLIFKVTGKNIYAVDSITVNSSSAGVASVDVASNLEGKQQVTVTSGAYSKVVNLTYAQAKADTGATLVINAPDSVLPGSTLSVSVVLTDKYGNTVTTDTNAGAASYLAGLTTPSFSFSSTSPGFQIGTNPSVTDKDGAAKLAYFLGANDSGSITVTATYDADGTATAFKPVTVTKTIAIGTSEANQGALATWTKDLGDGTLKMYAKNVIGQGKVQFYVNGKEVVWTRANTATDVEGASLRTVGSANYLVRTIDSRYLVDGKNVLTIVVDGYQMTRRVYSQK